MKCAVVLLASLTFSSITTASLAAGTAAPQSAPARAVWATWITRDVQVSLTSLPKSYSCDDLWYKLHGILLAIGAREYMEIDRYDCGAKAAGGGRSPTLDLKFQTLRELSGADTRWAQASATRKIVRLAPGEPKILDASDCALLSQLNGTLFAYLNMHVISADLRCSAPQSARRFSISVEALLPQPSARSPA
jgi:hypothetical protein